MDQASPTERSAEETLRLVVRAAWLAVLLGLGVQIAVVLAKALFGGRALGTQFLIDCAQGLTWSVLVCGAVALGSTAAKARSAMMGVLGLVSAPIAWAAAKGAQKGVQSLVGAPQDSFNAFFFMLSGVKAIEYLALGLLVGGLSNKPDAKLHDYVLMGGRIGALAAALVYKLSVDNAAVMGKTLSTAKIASIVTNELLFPIGCAAILGVLVHVRSYVAAVQAAAPKP